jgi:hypothetical protein
LIIFSLLKKRGGNKMAGLGLEGVTLAIIIGTLSAIVYSLRILVLLERRIARMDENLIKIANRLVREEAAVFKEEKKIESMLKSATRSGSKKKAVKKKK